MTTSGETMPRSAGDDGGAPPEMEFLGELYRPSMLEAYRAQPRGSARTGLDPERLQPRWRWSAIGVLILLVTAAVGMLVRVPLGPAGVIAGVSGLDIVVALPNVDPPAKGSAIALRLPGDAVVRGAVKDYQRGGGSVQVTMVLVHLNVQLSGDVAAGTRVVIDQGTRPLLLDVLDGGGERG